MWLVSEQVEEPTKMTIDSDWVHVMKGECPDSFTTSCPVVPQVIIIIIAVLDYSVYSKCKTSQ